MTKNNSVTILVNLIHTLRKLTGKNIEEKHVVNFGTYVLLKKYWRAQMNKTVTKQLVQNEHLNRRGTLFGGTMMSWMDCAAAIAAAEVVNMDCVTVAVDRIEFTSPVNLGDVVTFEVVEKERGRTSITLNVNAFKSNLKEKMIPVANSNFKFVAVDEEGRPSSAWQD